MKKLILFLCFFIFSNLTFCQIKKAGNFYELDDLWRRDSLSIKQLLNKFDLNVSKLEKVKFFKQNELNLKLHEENSYKSYIYTYDKNTNEITMKSFFKAGKIPMINKYVMMVCFDDFSGKKTITIKVF